MREALIKPTFILLFLGCLTGCDSSTDNNRQKNNPESNKGKVKIKDFSYIEIYPNRDAYILNEWLQDNPNKKVVSFSGVLAYREDVSGYILYFESGSNSNQRFVRIGCWNNQFSYLQDWKDSNPKVRIVAFTTIPQYSGGIKAFTICYEKNE